MNHLDWALSVSKKHLRPSSLGVYRSMWSGLERRLQQAGAPGPTQCDAQALAQALQGAGDYGTQRRLFRLVKWVYETLASAGLPVVDACESLEGLYRADVRPARRVHALADAQSTARRLSTGALSPQLVALAAVCELTGLKTAQLRSLTRSDVTLAPGEPSLRCRSRKEVRRWPLPPEVSEALQAWLAVHPCDRDDAALFCASASGTALAASTLWRQLQRVAGALDEETSHAGTGQFRARLAARLKAEGASLEDTRKALGHRQLESTQELLGRVSLQPVRRRAGQGA